MITLFHGEDSAQSRSAYLQLRQSSSDKVLLDGASLTLTDLTQALEGQDLFGSVKQIFIEDLLSKKKPSKELDAIVSSLTHSELPIALWESKELTTKQLSQFKNAVVKNFKIPSTIFAFLDGLYPSNETTLVKLFHQTLVDKDSEFVFFMMTRHIRTLLALSDESTQSISEISRMQSWQKGKLQRQVKLFTTDQLLDLYNKLFEIDVNMKTGNLTVPLEEAIDFLLVHL